MPCGGNERGSGENAPFVGRSEKRKGKKYIPRRESCISPSADLARIVTFISDTKKKEYFFPTNKNHHQDHCCSDCARKSIYKQQMCSDLKLQNRGHQESLDICLRKTCKKIGKMTNLDVLDSESSAAIPIAIQKISRSDQMVYSDLNKMPNILEE